MDFLEILKCLGIPLRLLHFGLLEFFQDLFTCLAVKVIIDLELYGFDVVFEGGTGRIGQSLHQFLTPLLQGYLLRVLFLWFFGVFFLFGVLNDRLLIEFEGLGDG